MSQEQHNKCKSVLDELFQALAWVHHYWHVYVALYGRTPERFEVFNYKKRMSAVFGLFERTLRDAILLEVAKLLGNHRSAGNEMVSIRRAIVDLPFPDQDPRKIRLLERLEAAKSKHQPILATRDSVIAHTDFAVVTKVKQLDSINRGMIREAIAECVSLANEVWLAFDGSTCAFGDGRAEENTISVMVQILELGNSEFDKLRKL